MHIHNLLAFLFIFARFFLFFLVYYFYSIIKISEIKFPSDYLVDQNRSLDRLLNKFLFPLLNKVITPSKQFFIEEKIERIDFDYKIKDIIERNFFRTEQIFFSPLYLHQPQVDALFQA